MKESDPVSRPSRIDEETWGAIPPGERIRFLRWGEESFFLDPDQYEELRSLPFWTFYGPEDGLPANWFNTRGFLLPRFRPGGPDYGIFRIWRRLYKLRRYVGSRLRNEINRCWQNHNEWFWLPYLFIYFFAGLVLHVNLSARYGDFAGSGLYFLVLIVLAMAFLLFASVFNLFLRPRLAAAFVEWQIRRVLKSRPESLDNYQMRLAGVLAETQDEFDEGTKC
jgi:hypothetical protein